MAKVRQQNINTAEFWDARWSTDGMLSRQCEKQIMKLVPEEGLSVLDIGCGTGRILRGLKKDRKAKCMGIDISRVAIYVLSRYGIEGMAGDVDNIHELKRKFDVVICSHTLEHITDDKRLVEEIRRLTKKYAIIAVPNNCIGPEELDEHVRKYDEASLRKLLQPHFRTIENHSIGIHLILKCFL